MPRPKPRAYSASQLEAFGFGNVSGIRKKARKAKFHSYTSTLAGQRTRFYLFADLPAEWRSKIQYQEDIQGLKDTGVDLSLPKFDQAQIEYQARSYSDAPNYNRRKADKYLNIEFAAGHLEGLELQTWIRTVWNVENPSMKTSYSSVMQERKKSKEQSKAALIGKWGQSRGRTVVDDKCFEYFKLLYLSENRPSAKSCWRGTMGKFAGERDASGEFPSVHAFMRRLRYEMSPSQIYRARYGEKLWQNKYGLYIERDYSDINAGQIWVMDHAQIDVACNLNGKTVFGWATSVVDMKTDKCLSTHYHAEAPNSDHIFTAFYLAVQQFGIPEILYIDNGKDFRCRDFAGGRPKLHKLQVDEQKVSGMLGQLGISAIFSMPYNARAKTIERWHLKIKDDLSRHCVGYRGGHIKERPESLAEDIKQGRVLDFDFFKGLLEDFVFNVLNKTISNGKRHRGVSPDDLWNSENPIKKAVTNDALKLFCMRTTKPLTIGRNGIRISSEDLTYFSDWMVPHKGRKVYLRRAVDNLNDAWVFAEETDEYLGNASIKGMVSAHVGDEVGRETLRKAVADQRREKRSVKETGIPRHVPDVAERLSNMKRANQIANPAPVPEPEQKVVRAMCSSHMEKVTRERKRRDREGTADLSRLVNHRHILQLHEQIEGAYINLMRMECDIAEAKSHAENVLMGQFAEVAGIDYDKWRSGHGLCRRQELKRGQASSRLNVADLARHQIMPERCTESEAEQRIKAGNE